MRCDASESHWQDGDGISWMRTEYGSSRGNTALRLRRLVLVLTQSYSYSSHYTRTPRIILVHEQRCAIFCRRAERGAGGECECRIAGRGPCATTGRKGYSTPFLLDSNAVLVLVRTAYATLRPSPTRDGDAAVRRSAERRALPRRRLEGALGAARPSSLHGFVAGAVAGIACWDSSPFIRRASHSNTPSP